MHNNPWPGGPGLGLGGRFTPGRDKKRRQLAEAIQLPYPSDLHAKGRENTADRDQPAAISQRLYEKASLPGTKASQLPYTSNLKESGRKKQPS